MDKRRDGKEITSNVIEYKIDYQEEENPGEGDNPGEGVGVRLSRRVGLSCGTHQRQPRHRLRVAFKRRDA